MDGIKAVPQRRGTNRGGAIPFGLQSGTRAQTESPGQSIEGIETFSGE